MGEKILPTNTQQHLQNREDGPSEAKMVVEKPTMPSVAQLAVKFQNQSPTSGKEIPAPKPARRKPPCSLPLHTQKAELGQNGELKPSPNSTHPVRVKVKSSPLIEKLQANLAFAPASLLPGASPKSPGLKSMISPFSSPPSTPISPQSHSSEPDETPVSFDQPPEGTHLQFYNKVRTRGSIKRRPPSRRFRKSQSEFGDDTDLGILPQENGGKEEDEDSAFTDQSKTTKPVSLPVDGIDHHEKQNQVASTESNTSELRSNKTERKEEEVGTEETMTLNKDNKEEKPDQQLSKELPCGNTKEDKENSLDLDIAQDVKIKSEKNPLRDKEDGSDSEQVNCDKEERQDQLSPGQETKKLLDTQDIGTPAEDIAEDTESAASSRV
uniref:RCSD domain containing 1 n=1 Tax=Salvator merianae TaxID=96440 RepID=A0A8D0AYY8_SALMN